MNEVAIMCIFRHFLSTLFLNLIPLLLFCFQVRAELQGRPYEKNHIELILSAINVQDKYITFLRNTEEDLSSIFCSELVAHAYQEFGLLGET